ncbi:hypothetical protein AB0L06_27990 [Spirillospora sp. NPDC052269]
MIRVIGAGRALPATAGLDGVRLMTVHPEVISALGTLALRS